MGYKEWEYYDQRIAQLKVQGEGLVLRLKEECEEILKRGYDVNTTALTKIEAIVASLYENESDMALTRRLKAEEEAKKRAEENEKENNNG